MGMVQRYVEEVEARGWWGVDTTICSRCVMDQALVELIRGEGGTSVCDYCAEEPAAPDASAAFEIVLEAVVDGIRHEYERPVDSMGWDGREGGWVGAAVFDTYDLLWDLEITERDDVHQDLFHAIIEPQWCEYDPYAVRPHEALASGWEHFREYVKHERRYTFFMTKDDRTLGAGDIPMDRVPFAVT
ncbi:MAG: HEPN-associated N-terminal domain-containing protein, partial [Propionicimonas sp.]